MYYIGTLVLIIQLLFGGAFPCRAAESGGAAPLTEEERPVITSVSISPGTAVVSKNGTCTFTASVSGENNYSREVAWSVSGQTSQNTFIDGNGILNVASDETASSMIVKAISRQDSNYSAAALVTVQASNYYIQLQASPENGGSVFGSGTVKEGGYAVISAEPNSGFTFEGWFLNDNRVSQDARYVADNIRGDATYVAEFKQVECRVNVNVNDSNAGTATEGRTVKYGEGITLEAAPKDGYQFDGWTENGNTVSRDSRLQVDNITEERTFTAVFKKKEIKNYTITASVSSANGTVTPEGSTTVKEGSGVYYTISPKKGYAIRAVYVDGKEIGKTSSFNFTDVRGDHTISADFVEEPTQAGEGGNQVSDRADQTEKTDRKGTEDPEKKPEDKEEKEKSEGTGEDRRESDREEKEETEQLTGTLAELKVSAGEAERMIAEGREEELLAGAMETGDLQITVHNDFAGGDSDNRGAAGFEAVAGQLLGRDEKLEMLHGNLPVVIELYITDMEGKASQQVKDFFEEKKLPGMEIGRYFEISLKETKNGETQNVSELPEKLKVTVALPKHLKADNRKFYILGLHAEDGGSQDLVQFTDEDDDPDSISFSTDQLTSYAVAYIDWKSRDTEISETTVEKPHGRDVKDAAVAVIVVAALAATVTGTLYVVGRRKR